MVVDLIKLVKVMSAIVETVNSRSLLAENKD